MAADWDGADASDRDLNADITQLNTAIQALSNAAKSSSAKRYKQLAYVNEQLCTYNGYHAEAAAGGYALRYPWSALSALDQLTVKDDANGSLKPVCEGYARAFKLICDALEIPCVLVSGNANSEKHMWNYVQMENGYWYAVDVTWNDSTGKNGYFLVGKDVMSKEHTASNVIMSSGQLTNFCTPVLSQSAYEYTPLSLTASSNNIFGGETVILTAHGLREGDISTVTCSESACTLTRLEDGNWLAAFPDVTATHTFTLSVAGESARVICTVSVTHRHDYSYEHRILVEATCTDEGLDQSKCACGHTIRETLPALPHRYEVKSEREATCQHPKETVKVCTVCNKQVTEQEGEPLAHRFSQNGFCTECGVIQTDPNDPNKSFTEGGKTVIVKDGSLLQSFGCASATPSVGIGILLIGVLLGHYKRRK